MAAHDAALLAELIGFGAATVHEAQGRTGAMDAAVKPIAPGMRLAGPAFTLASPPGDNLTLHAALERAAPGDVLVVDAEGHVEAGPFGDVLAVACQARGLAGLVIDGSVRDTAAIAGLGFAVFSRGVSIKGTAKRALGPIGVPILCAGAAVAPGDIVIGDDDGVVVVKQAEAERIVEAARRRVAAEADLVARIKTGASTVDLLGLRAVLDRLERRAQPAPRDDQ